MPMMATEIMTKTRMEMETETETATRMRTALPTRARPPMAQEWPRNRTLMAIAQG
jgi:hypothetical protein